MRALITGISGFVGQHLSNLLLENNYEVFGTYYKNEPACCAEVNKYNCDIRNPDVLKRILYDVKPDEIYHLAGPAHIPSCSNDMKQVFEVIVGGATNLYEAVRVLGITPKILYVGSGDEYGESAFTGYPVSENHVLKPVNPYSVSKASADLISYHYHKAYEMRIIRVRPFNHTGPGQKPNFVCSDFAKQIAEIEIGENKQIIVGNIFVERDFCDVRDVVMAYWQMIKTGKDGEVYNVCSGVSRSIESILRELINLSLLDSVDTVVASERLRKLDFSTIKGDPSKIISEIGWKPAFSFTQTLKDLLDFWRNRI